MENVVCLDDLLKAIKHVGRRLRLMRSLRSVGVIQSDTHRFYSFRIKPKHRKHLGFDYLKFFWVLSPLFEFTSKITYERDDEAINVTIRIPAVSGPLTDAIWKALHDRK